MNKMKKFTLGLCLVMLVAGFGHSAIVMNSTCNLFNPSPCSPDEGLSQPQEIVRSLDTLIILGGSSYLQSYRDTIGLLDTVERIEIVGVDYQNMKTLTQSAIDNIRLSIAYYEEIIDISGTLNYDKEMLNKLDSFDYAN